MLVIREIRIQAWYTLGRTGCFCSLHRLRMDLPWLGWEFLIRWPILSKAQPDQYHGNNLAKRKHSYNFKLPYFLFICVLVLRFFPLFFFAFCFFFFFVRKFINEEKYRYTRLPTSKKKWHQKYVSLWRNRFTYRYTFAKTTCSSICCWHVKMRKIRT